MCWTNGWAKDGGGRLISHPTGKGFNGAIGTLNDAKRTVSLGTVAIELIEDVEETDSNSLLTEAVFSLISCSV